jgi:hypothetical protein
VSSLLCEVLLTCQQKSLLPVPMGGIEFPVHWFRNSSCESDFELYIQWPSECEQRYCAQRPCASTMAFPSDCNFLPEKNVLFVDHNPKMERCVKLNHMQCSSLYNLRLRKRVRITASHRSVSHKNKCLL